MYFQKIRIFVGVLLAGVFLTAQASAQMVVSDPTNLVQNSLSRVADVRQVKQQIDEIANQIEQIEMMRRNLEKLSPESLSDLREAFAELAQLYERAQHIGMEWGQIDSQFDTLYEDYDPQADGYEGYQRKRKRWEEQTEEAIRAAMIAHGVMEDYGGREADLEALVNASDSAEGALAAIQAGNRISAVLAKQMMELSQLIIADSRAKLSYMKEKQMRDKSSRTRSKEDLLGDFGEHEDYERPPNEFPEIR